MRAVLHGPAVPKKVRSCAAADIEATRACSTRYAIRLTTARYRTGSRSKLSRPRCLHGARVEVVPGHIHEAARCRFYPGLSGQQPAPPQRTHQQAEVGVRHTDARESMSAHPRWTAARCA